jgi:hypothetical protein
MIKLIKKEIIIKKILSKLVQWEINLEQDKNKSLGTMWLITVK